MDETREFDVTLRLQDGYRVEADFGDDLPPLLMDEPAPLGEGTGPNAARVLGAAVGNCLAASLAFCLKRSRIELRGLTADVHGTIVRNDAGRFRIGSISVALAPDVAEADRARMGRCLEVFEDFCIVTQSVRAGLDVSVSVQPVAV